MFVCSIVIAFVFFFNDTATTEIYTLSLHDALPISAAGPASGSWSTSSRAPTGRRSRSGRYGPRSRASSSRSEEHTSELQSRQYLVCRLLLEKKKKKGQIVRVHFQTRDTLISHMSYH